MSLCLLICTSFERQSLLCFKMHFFQLQWVSCSSLSGCAHALTYICIWVFTYLYNAARHVLPPACRNISWLFYGVTCSDSLRWIPWENVVLLSTLLRIAKLTTPADPSSLFSSEKRKPPGTSRHEQSRQADCLPSAVLLIPFALELTEWLFALNIVFLSLIYSNRKQL